MQRLVQISAIFLLILTFSACGSKVNQENFDKIKSGKTTKQEVVDILGKPDETMTRAGGSQWSRMVWRDDKTGHRIVVQFSADVVLIPYYDKGQGDMDDEDQ